jgi:hypothetical protein
LPQVGQHCRADAAVVAAAQLFDDVADQRGLLGNEGGKRRLGAQDVCGLAAALFGSVQPAVLGVGELEHLRVD